MKIGSACVLIAGLLMTNSAVCHAGMFDDLEAVSTQSSSAPSPVEERAPSPRHVRDDASLGEWRIVVEPADNLFPSFIISTATIDYEYVDEEGNPDPTSIGDPGGMIGLEVVNPADNTPVKLVISANRYMLESVASGIMAHAGEVYTVTPKINYQYDELLNVHQQTPLNLVFTVWIGDELQPPVVKTVTLRSINDCMLAFSDADPTEVAYEDVEIIDTSWSIAAYVNENHPLIALILKEALRTGIVDSFDGYQSEDPAAAYAQVFAIWSVLREKGIKYSDITANAEASGRVFSQHVRLIDESITHSQANCVDGSVLLASILRKIGLHASLVLVPGHCFVAFSLDRELEEIRGLETTVIGAQDIEPSEYPDRTLRKLARAYRNREAWRSFAAAIAIGTYQLFERADAFADENDMDHWLIDLQDARDMGIMPLGYRKNPYQKMNFELD